MNIESKKQPLISFLIPTFNNEATINNCLKSLLQFKKDEIEIIVADSSSSDDTVDIINQYKSKFNITLITGLPKGIFSARLLMINKANGKYVVSLDSDDNLTANYRDIVLKLIESNKDIYIYKRTVTFLDGHDEDEKEQYTNCNDNFSKYLKRLLSTNDQNCLWNKIIKTTLLTKAINGVQPNITTGEDRYINLLLAQNVLSIEYSNYCLYHYFVTITGATNSFNASYYDGLLINAKLTFKINEMYNNLLDDKGLLLGSTYFLNNILAFTKNYNVYKKDKENVINAINNIINSKEFDLAYKNKKKAGLSIKNKVYLFMLKHHHYAIYYKIIGIKNK